MAHRILHCGKSLENHQLCIQHQVVGFISRGASPNDVVYLAIKIGKITYCGVRGILGEVTDIRPWPDSDAYVHCLEFKNIEFCKPFEIKILADIGGKYWSLKYLQSAKAIGDEAARQLLDATFEKNQINNLDVLLIDSGTSDLEDTEIILTKGYNNYDSDFNDYDDSDDEITDEALTEVSDAAIHVMGTFQTISFYNETGKVRGLEKLVNENFYSLFPRYPESKTLLISDNRMFITEGARTEDQELITGIRTIPDALLIIYREGASSPFQINLVEYECYGEKKTRALEKSTYFNGHIIPQLMKFASSFSVVTDRQIREKTAKKWTRKIIDCIYSDPTAQEKMNIWIREIHPGLSEQRVALEIQESLLQAFRTNLQVMLVIDELSAEQKSTISNVVKAFKLENGTNVNFVGYIVRLEQKIRMIDGSAEYALSVQ